MNEPFEDNRLEVGDFIEYEGISFVVYYRSSIVSKLICTYNETHNCPAKLWLWNNGCKVLTKLHENHDENEDEENIDPMSLQRYNNGLKNLQRKR